MEHEFTLHTLIDITDTGMRQDSSTQNYRNILNSLGLHFQPVIAETETPRLLTTPSPFQSNRPVWFFNFKTEGDAVFAVEIAVRALNRMPVCDPIYKFVRTDSGPVCNLLVRQQLIPNK